MYFGLCCCANDDSGTAKVHVYEDAEFVGASGAALPQASSTPQFPTVTAKRYDAVDDASDTKSSSLVDYSTSTTPSLSSDARSLISGQAIEIEKSRLQSLVKSFAQEAVAGIEVSRVYDIATGGRIRCLFTVDRCLYRFTLRPLGSAVQTTPDSAAEELSPLETSFDVWDVASMRRGGDVAQKVPSLGSIGNNCVYIETRQMGQALVLYFDTDYERDKFYTCMKILRLSSEIKRTQLLNV